jgi:flagellar hook-associated protein 2
MAIVANTTRITGLFSGIDTDALVKAMSMNQQRKVDMLNSKKTQAEWKRDLLTDFNNKIRIFRDTYGSVLGENNLMSRGSFTSFSVKMAENSGVGIVASASAKSGSYNVRVDQIATASTMQGSKLTGRSTGLSTAEINSTGVGRLTALTNGSFGGDTVSFTINDVDFTFSSNDSLKKIMDTVNNSKAGVTMSYTQTSDRVTITSKTLGAANGDPSKTISFSDDSGFLQHLGLVSTSSGEVANGRDAVVYLNGETEARRLDTNTITLDGIQMTFLRATGVNGVDYTLEADYKPAVNNVKKMVEAFNTLMKELHTAYNQKVNRSFKPLTADQRNEFSDKEIEDWEVKAKEGLLYRDHTLGKLLENMRGVLSKSFGSYGNLASIGITTGRYMVGEPAQLEIDEDKLMQALQSDPDRVYNLMSASASDGGGGLMTQLNKMMDDYVGSIKGYDLQNLNTNIHNYTKSVQEQENKLVAMSEKYYLQYAKLETALSQMQSQQNSMSSLFGINTQQ